ncbi:outer membrane beta-barrel protein [Terrimonas pollutisoli]|uniref:outer membrane beta-barrel protein n=1 Tax=Terrimonas pollutisoli TaxID=3034147 RepID=UPI0023EAFE2E|nr:outer membrane beta-barrel protein [Terrimonas sp. H1YJ31]
MKKLLLAFVFLPLLSAAQNFHFSGRLGIANYQGDLKKSSVSLSQAKLFFSLGARYDLSEHVMVRSYLSLTGLQADDKKGTATMQQRNLNFKSKIFDWELTGQYSFFSLNDKWWTPYVFAGIGLFHFNPYTKDTNGSKAFLKPLSTEGQGFLPGVKEYKLWQFNLPFGVGAEYSLNEDMRLGLELGYRKLFTDHLDDVSGNYVDQSKLLTAKGQQAVDLAYRGDEVGAGPYPSPDLLRGKPKNKDGYYYVAVTYTVRYFFDKYKQIAGLPGGKRSKKVGCPATRY